MNEENESSGTDWAKCALCQNVTDEALLCPAESKRQDSGAGYCTMGNNLLAFDALQALPFDLKRLMTPNCELQESLSRQKAKWHKSCSLKFCKLKLQRAQKRKAKEPDESENAKYLRPKSEHDDEERKCFFCDTKGSPKNVLHNVETLGVDAKIRHCAHQLQDMDILAKLSAGDLVALEACYHASCLVLFCRKAAKTQSNDDENSDILHGIAFAELVEYIEEKKVTSQSPPVFRLSKLCELYKAKLEEIGLEVSRVHSTRLKERLLQHFPDLQTHKEGKSYILMFESDVSKALKNVHESTDEEGMILKKAAQIIRRDMLRKTSIFDGTFDDECQVNSVSPSLLYMIRMMLEGPGITADNDDSGARYQARLSIAQLITYNAVTYKSKAEKARHHSSKETPLPVYLGLAFHAKTRKRELVDILHGLGLSISYDRVLSLSNMMGNRVCRQYQEEGVICPPKLRFGITTGIEMDNIDVDPRSTTSMGSLHGTGISLSQNISLTNPGQPREPSEQRQVATDKLSKLPDFYANVMPLMLKNNSPEVSAVYGQTRPTSDHVEPAMKSEQR